jgi:4-amino-4-deoxy-L-arabinose transferase-like glycosyltransferase
MFYQSTPWMKYSAMVVLLATIIHFAFGFILGLSVDEAHYALYALHPDWSYFDHPPLVGWLQILPVKLNWHDGWLRLIPEILWLISILLNVGICQMVLGNYGQFSNIQKPAIFWTIALACLSPILHVLGVGLLPDTILLVLVPAMIILVLLLHHELSKRQPHDFILWIGMGVLLGLAGLSKYTSIFFALCIPLCLLAWHGGKIFQRPGLYICLIIALLLLTPVLYWNFVHDWISFQYQFSHGTGGTWQIKKVGVFLLNQIASYGLLILIGLIWFIRSQKDHTITLMTFFILPILLFAYFSGGGGSLPHWTAPAWIAMTPFAGIGIAQAFVARKKILIQILVCLQVFICVLGFTLLFTGGIPGVSMQDSLGKKNPIADLYGWEDAGNTVRQLATETQTDRLVVQNWTLASRLAWYAKPLRVNVLDDRFDQFDLWVDELPLGSDAILLNWSQMAFTLPVSDEGFESCDPLKSQAVQRLGRDIAQFDFYLCKNWQGHSSPQRTP